MAIGPIIRQMFGPLEKPISNLYRNIFIDLTALAKQIQEWAPASTILELGCGEGALIERLAKRFPKANITGIDITPRVGRLFSGDLDRVTFRQQTIKDFANENLASIDLLVICDVMHHVPWKFHMDILMDAGKSLRRGGYLILKDWERNASLIHFLCHFSDRYITGDDVKYKTADEWRNSIKEVFGANCIKAEARISPHANNIAFLVQI